MTTRLPRGAVGAACRDAAGRPGATPGILLIGTTPPIVMIETWNDFEESTDVEYGTGGDCLCYLPLLMRIAAAQRVVVR